MLGVVRVGLQTAGPPQLPDTAAGAVVKVERPEGPNDLDRGSGRGSVGLVAGAADRRAKSRTPGLQVLPRCLSLRAG